MKFSSSLMVNGILLILMCGVSVKAQKKPRDIQEGNIFLSVPVKVDGKLNDWQDTLQAFNRNALLAYSIANDEKNIYLAVKSQDPITSARILSGGLTFSINTEGKKKEDEAFRITFPVARPVVRGGSDKVKGLQDKRKQDLYGSQKAFGRSAQGGKPGKTADSAALEKRRSQLAQFKEIGLAGFKEIPDSLISIYNLHGIKVGSGYDGQGSLIYEIAVPMKLMHISPEAKSEFAYNIKINGRPFTGKSFSDSRNTELKDRAMRQRNGFGGDEERNYTFSSFTQSVDFWGKYSVAAH